MSIYITVHSLLGLVLGCQWNRSSRCYLHKRIFFKQSVWQDAFLKCKCRSLNFYLEQLLFAKAYFFYFSFASGLLHLYSSAFFPFSFPSSYLKDLTLSYTFLNRKQNCRKHFLWKKKKQTVSSANGSLWQYWR